VPATVFGFARAVLADAVRVDVQRVVADAETALVGDLFLAFFDFGAVELFDMAALHADEVVVMAALVELVNRLA